MSPSNEFVYVQREQCGNGCSRPQRIPPGYAGTMRRSSGACSGAFAGNHRGSNLSGGLSGLLNRFSLSKFEEDDILLIALILLLAMEDGCEDNYLMLAILAMLYFS